MKLDDSHRPEARADVARHLVAVSTIMGALALSASSAAAERIPDLGLDRVTVLPEYCEYSQDGKHGYDIGNPTPAHRRWIAVLGPTMHHIHHYCRGLKAAQKARDPMLSQQLRTSMHATVIKEATYVAERAPADFLLMPEIYLRMGQAALGMGDVASALAYFDRSRQAKPDYWPAYIELARTNLSFGRRNEAEAALQAGLQASPDSAPLKKALEQLSASSGEVKRPKPAASAK